VEFMKWVLTGGQRYVPEMGYLPPGPERIAQGLRAVGGADKGK
jgi:hypothetical protein